nr:TetR family transcriptional regulator [Thermosporothrix hazakensis]
MTLEALTNQLEVSKGSFYHHFQHFQDYKEQLLSFMKWKRRCR